MVAFPPSPTLWAIMSTAMLASASAANTRWLTPGRSGTPSSTTRASSAASATPHAGISLIHGASGTIHVPTASDFAFRTIKGHVELLGELDRPRVHDAGAHARHLQHLVVADGVHLAGVGDDPRVGGVHAVHVGVDLALDVVPGELDRGRDRHRGGVAAAPPQGGDVAQLVHALEAGQHDDVPAVERLAQAVRVDLLDPALRCVLSVTMPICGPVKLTARSPSSWIAIAVSAMLICSPVASSMSISRADGADVISPALAIRSSVVLPLRRHHHDDAVTGVLGADRLAGGLHHAVRVLDARPAELLHHDAHARTSRLSRDLTLRCMEGPGRRAGGKILSRRSEQRV
jgi:hypothetical protein